MLQIAFKWFDSKQLHKQIHQAAENKPTVCFQVFLGQACFVICFPLAYASAIFGRLIFFLSPSLSLGTVWLVGAVIEQLLFDQESNRDCTQLTLPCLHLYACLYSRVHAIVCI